MYVFIASKLFFAAKVHSLLRTQTFNFSARLCNFPNTLKIYIIILQNIINFTYLYGVKYLAKSKIMKSFSKRHLSIDELWCNHKVVSVHKYGFFLCLNGKARILLGNEVYNLSAGSLCIYTPNTIVQILEKSTNLDGILEEDAVETYYPVVSTIDIHKRLQIRQSPCVNISEEDVNSIHRLVGIICSEQESECAQYLRFALCLKILEIYFGNKPESAIELTKEDNILNNFIICVYENCHTERSVQFYADKQHLSPYYFSSIIKKRSGKSAMQWIENVTMTFAKQYIECSDMSLKQISDCLNFPDQSVFGRYFKKREGLSPSEYRKRKKM